MEPDMPTTHHTTYELEGLTCEHCRVAVSEAGAQVAATGCEVTS
jgi:hypothetical protein